MDIAIARGKGWFDKLITIKVTVPDAAEVDLQLNIHFGCARYLLKQKGLVLDHCWPEVEEEY